MSPPIARSLAGHQSPGFGGGEGAASQRPPLPTTAYEYFHGELGASAANAIGQLATITLPGTGTPVVGVDTGFFREKPVYQSAITGSKGWRQTGLTTGINASTRPYYAAVCRTRTMVTTSGGNITAFAAGGGSGATEDQCRLLWDSDGAGVDRYQFLRRHNSGNIVANTGDIQDANVHFFEMIHDATAGDVLYCDGVSVASTTAGNATDAVTTGVTYAGIGVLASAAANFSNTSLAFWLWCTAAPSAAERAALLAWSRAYWGSV